MHLRAPAAAAVTALLLLTACGGGGKAAAPTVHDKASECDTTKVDPNELEALLPAKVPAGYDVQPDDVGDTGPSDFDKAVSDDGEDDAAEALKEARFLRGYQRLWVDERTDAEFISFLYEFCEPSGATENMRRTDKLQADYMDAFEVAGLDANGYESSDEDGFGIAAVVTTTGRYAIQTVADGPLDEVDAAELRTLATDLALAMAAELDPASA